MTKFIYSLFIAIFLLTSTLSKADEGMWIPALLQKYNEADMIKKGLKITAEDIYSINQSSLKDAIVLFGRGCTGEIISSEGLLLTNHHCGYGQIQQHSSIDNDYLTNGFWAMSKSEELTNPDLTVQFLIRMEDVTEKVENVLTSDMSEKERQYAIDEISEQIIKEACNGTNYNAVVKPLYYGNQYFLYVMETYKDVRLVGAPPSAIGKFGGDTDNWMWPRHTGDFSMFRIYTAPDGSPAEYSSNNIPMKAKKHFKISLKGVEKGDFTMVYGYPYETQEYLPSYAVDMLLNQDRPTRVELRQIRLDIMREFMEKDPMVRIQYSSKYAGIANGWKKWQGVIKGLNRLDAIEKKQNLEADFTKWVTTNDERMMKYGNVLSDFEKLYQDYSKLNYWEVNFFESIWGIEIIKYANKYERLAYLDKGDEDAIDKLIQGFKNGLPGNFKDYYAPIDKKVFASMVEMFISNIDKAQQPTVLNIIDEKFNGDVNAYADYVFEKSVFSSEEKVIDFLNSYKLSKKKVLLSDPAYQIMIGFVNYYRENYAQQIVAYEAEIERLMRLYMKGQMEMQNDKLFYPDANATLRLTYGQVKDYEPYDGGHYSYFTTLEGIMEKDNPEVYDYDVPEKLKELYLAKDYGRYGNNGQLNVAFTASNHTTGGNSGSPVLNANGELIGVNFDRNWEGTMSDIMYDPNMCRNISLDIRYCLFIIDKFAGASHLVDEMDIIE